MSTALIQNERLIIYKIKKGISYVHSNPIWLVAPLPEKCNLSCSLTFQ